MLKENEASLCVRPKAYNRLDKQLFTNFEKTFRLSR